MPEPFSLHEHRLMLARGALEHIADAIESAAVADMPMKVSIFLTAKALALTLRDMNGTALNPTGPWGGLTMVATFICDGDLEAQLGEVSNLVDAVWAARRIPSGIRPRSGGAPECVAFLDKLEGIQARVVGYGVEDR